VMAQAGNRINCNISIRLRSVSTEGQGQARESQSACGKNRGKRLRPTEQCHCNTQEVGLAVPRTPSTEPTSDLDV